MNQNQGVSYSRVVLLMVFAFVMGMVVLDIFFL